MVWIYNIIVAQNACEVKRICAKMLYDTALLTEKHLTHLYHFAVCAIIAEREINCKNSRKTDTFFRKVGQKMYTRQNHPAAMQTEALLCAGLNRLMAQQPFSQITVTRLCQAAGVGRKSFYRHFETTRDILQLQVDVLYQEFELRMSTTAPEEMIRSHLEFLQGHVDFLTLLQHQGMLEMLSAKFEEILPQVMPQWSADLVEQEYLSAYISAGISALFRIWAIRGFAEGADRVAEIAAAAQRGLLP